MTSTYAQAARSSAAQSPWSSRSTRRTTESELAIGGITVHVVRKPIKNMYLRIKPPTGSVEISAPMRMSDARIIAFVRERRDWVIRQQQRVRAAGRRALTGIDDRMPSTSNGADGGDNPSYFDRSQVWNDERRKRAAAAINAALPALLATWVPIIGRRPTHITLRVMTSRWGSCTPKTGRIRLNLQLGLMEPRFLEYVLVHEMTHLWENGHGAGFQRRMDAYLPDWRRLRRELNARVVL